MVGVGGGAAVSASRAGVQLCPSAPGGDAATFGTASAVSSPAAGPPSLSLPCPVRPAGGRVRRGLPARVDVIVARPAVGPCMRQEASWGLHPVPCSLLLPAGGFLSFYL